MTVIDTCENRCENCVYVDRGYDEYSHPVHSISSECPIYEKNTMFFKINHRYIPIELVTGWIGCRHFRLDEGYKKQCEDTEQFIEGMNKQWDKARAKKQ